MFALLGKIFGSQKAIDGVISSVKDGLDALVYTDEERENDAKKERAEARGLLIEWLKNTQGQNLARRVIALIVIAMWAAMYGVAAILSAVSVWAGGKALTAAEMLADFAAGMGTEVMVVIGFYFAAPHLGKFIDLGLKKAGRA